MALFEWSESMSVGVAQLDSDHKAIIGLINRLNESLQSEWEITQLGEIFDMLISYIEWHFAREEEILGACDYPDMAGQRSEHESFARYIYRARDMYLGEANLAMAHALRDYLRNWIEHHILVSDMGYRPYVMDNPVAKEAARDFGPGLGVDKVLEEPAFRRA